MSIEIYKTIHIVGALLLFISFGSITYFYISQSPTDHFKKRFIALQHGIGMFLILLGGFGLLAKLKITFPWPGWVFAKLAIWLVFGFVLLLVRKMPRISHYAWVGSLLLATIAIYLVMKKPF